MCNLNEDELNQARIWNRYSQERGYLQSTIDPNDSKGLKCDYIDRWSRYYINKYVLGTEPGDILEIGSGSGRNLLALAPCVNHAYGIDIAQKQIEKALKERERLGIGNVSFFKDLDSFVEVSTHVSKVFSMWVLAHIMRDEDVTDMLIRYLDRIPTLAWFLFFEQVAREPYEVMEGGVHYKSVRTVSQYEDIFTKSGLEIVDFNILNEKGFGPLYRLLYLSRLYRHWPLWLNVNKVLFALDRHIVKRKISDVFTDCLFGCRRAK
jgi:SAM-dependent methyltransferase